MSPKDRPAAYGVFKPVGHVIVAFPHDSDLQSALTALVRGGLPQSEIAAYTPEQMRQQADIDIEQAGVLAGIGQELNLVKAHRELAVQGHSFLVIKAPTDEVANRIAEVATTYHATRAQRYGHLMIEELIEVGSGQNQVAESPDRGLDAQTRSGRESSSGR